MQDRTLAWDGCLNVRDLGGHPTEDGAETLWGSVIRADSVRSLTDAGWAALTAHGVSTVVDLRSHGELADDPPRELELDVVHVPVLAEEGDPVWREIDTAKQWATDGDDQTRRFYLELLRRWNDRFAAAIAAVSEARAGGVVVHCKVGKDRTGIVAALLLRLAGVSREDVAADYGLSAPRLEAQALPWVEEARDELERARRLRIVASPAGAMSGVLEAIEAEHGSVARFLRAGGLDEASVAAAGSRLRG